MKCKAHPYERGAGVCASCLRERLVGVAAAQDGPPDGLCGKPQPLPPPPPAPLRQPPPLVGPRSVATYLSHRRSFGSSAELVPKPPRRYLRRFYSTPQPPHSAAIAAEDGDGGGGRRSRFSLFSILFGRSRPEANSDPEEPRGSWLSALLHVGCGRRRDPRQLTVKKEEDAAATTARPWRPSFRGISPVRSGNWDESSRCSGDSTDSSGTWRRALPKPMRLIPAAQRRSHLSGYAVCLTPLVRASPRRGPTDVGPTEYRHAQGACSSFGPNRSRKLVDIGRL